MFALPVTVLTVMYPDFPKHRSVLQSKDVSVLYRNNSIWTIIRLQTVSNFSNYIFIPVDHSQNCRRKKNIYFPHLVEPYPGNAFPVQLRSTMSRCASSALCRSLNDICSASLDSQPSLGRRNSAQPTSFRNQPGKAQEPAPSSESL